MMKFLKFLIASLFAASLCAQSITLLSATNCTGGATTCTLDATGANWIGACLVSSTLTGATTVTDPTNGAYTSNVASGGMGCWYRENATGSSGLVLTTNCSACAWIAFALSGVKTTGSADALGLTAQTNGTTGTTMTAGPANPGAGNHIVIVINSTFTAGFGSTWTADAAFSGFFGAGYSGRAYVGGVNYDGFFSYKIENAGFSTSAVSVNNTPESPGQMFGLMQSFGGNGSLSGSVVHGLSGKGIAVH